jgi:CRISPR-associated protein Csm5
MKWHIETLSPVHIGNGKKLGLLDYALFSGGFHRVDISSLLKDNDLDIEEFIVSTSDFESIGNYQSQIKHILKNHIQYSLSVSNNARGSLGRKDIFEFVKTAGNVYLPGSSLKGAFRTALFYSLLNGPSDLYEKAVRYLKDDLECRSKAGPSSKIEKMIFGDTTHDIFKSFQISDTEGISCSCLNVDTVDVVNLSPSGSLFVKFNQLAETVKIGTRFYSSIHIDDFFFSEQADELGFGNKKHYIDNYIKHCRLYSDDLIDYEYEFFENHNDQYNDLLDFYDRLYDIHDDNDNCFLLRLSWGSGWQSMTAGRLFEKDETFWNLLREKYRLGRLHVPVFPKTRRLVKSDDHYYPLGWVKVVVEE